LTIKSRFGTAGPGEPEEDRGPVIREPDIDSFGCPGSTNNGKCDVDGFDYIAGKGEV
jgi:hypothetical protein